MGWLSKGTREFAALRQLLYLGFGGRYILLWASLMAQQVKKPPALQKTDVGLILVSGRPLEEHMPTHSSILGWRIPWTEEPGRLQSWGCKSRAWLSDYHTTGGTCFCCAVPSICSTQTPRWLQMIPVTWYSDLCIFPSHILSGLWPICCCSVTKPCSTLQPHAL